MKKVISVLLLACMLLTLTACGSQPAAPATDPTAEATEAPAAETAEAEYKLGMGVSVSLDSSDTNKAQVDATVATVVTDSEGKIVLCRIDCAQNKMVVTGVEVGTGEAYVGQFLAINPGGITTPLIGTATTDPAFGLPAHWIDDRQKEAAQMAGFTVVDSETVMATHLSHLMQVQAAKLLSRTETQQLVEHVAKLAPKLIEEVVPKMVSIATFQKVLQLLLEESVHIRDIRTIIETLAEHAVGISDPAELARRVRIALSPAIVQQIYGPTRELNVIAIEPGLDRLLVPALGNTAGPALDPGVADILPQNAAEVSLKQEEMGLPACLLVPDAIRSAIARLVRRAAPRLLAQTRCALDALCTRPALHAGLDAASGGVQTRLHRRRCTA